MEADFSAVTLAFALVTFSWLTLPCNCTLQAALTLRLSTFAPFSSETDADAGRLLLSCKDCSSPLTVSAVWEPRVKLLLFPVLSLTETRMPPCLLFPRLMVEFCSETERTTLSFFTNCITLSMTCRLYCWAAAADLEESGSANRLSCNSSSEARNTEKSFFIRIGSFLMSGGGWSDGTAPFACQTKAFADAFIRLLRMFLSIMQSLLPKRIPYFFFQINCCGILSSFSLRM